MVDTANRASRDLEIQMEQLAARYRDITAMSLTASGVQAVSFAQSMSAPAARPADSPQRYNQFREMWFGAHAGLTLGGIIGSVVPFIGTVVGGLVGLVVGIFSGSRQYSRNAEERQRREYIADLRDNVLPKLDAGRRRLSQDLNSQVRDYGRALLGALDDEITARGDSLAESVRRLAEAKQRNAASRAARERVLTARQQKLAELRQVFDALRRRADTPAPRPAAPIANSAANRRHDHAAPCPAPPLRAATRTRHAHRHGDAVHEHAPPPDPVDTVR